MQLRVGKESQKLPIQNVYHVPTLDINLLSTMIIMDKGFEISMKNGEINIFEDGKIFATTSRDGNMYKLNLDTEFVTNNMLNTKELNLWHHQLGYLRQQNIQLLAEGLATGISVDKNSSIGICEHCLAGGQHRLPSNYKASRASNVLELIYFDICGPMQTISNKGVKYFLLFIDDYSQMTVVYFLKSKSEAFSKFCEYKAYVENYTNRKIK